MSPFKGSFEDDVPFPKVGYVSSPEGIFFHSPKLWENLMNNGMNYLSTGAGFQPSTVGGFFVGVGPVKVN